jgi:hypothetical protein
MSFNPDVSTSAISNGTPGYAQKEKKRVCTANVALGKPDLSKASEYYRKHETLEGLYQRIWQDN